MAISRTNTEETVSKGYVTISLSLFGEKLIPEDVTVYLDMKPTKAWKKGAVHVTATGREIVREMGLWSYKKRFGGHSFKNSLDQFFSIINLDSCLKTEIADIEKIRLGGFVAVASDGKGAGAGEIFLRPDQLEKLSDIGAELMIDVSIDGEN